MDELRRRDPKSIYQRYENGELINVAGLDLSVDHLKRLIDFASNLESIFFEIDFNFFIASLGLSDIDKKSLIKSEVF